MNFQKTILDEMHAIADQDKRVILSRFFKTGKGQYGEGDVFLGVSVPQTRLIVKEFWQKTNWEDLNSLIQSKYHEIRLLALLILVEKFSKAKKNPLEKEKIVSFYLKHTPFINNWDLVDQSCYKILGQYCFENQKDDILHQLSNSDILWEKRIAIVSTMYYIKNKSYQLTIALAERNLYHKHDLMHKANGWLLREMGKKSPELLIDFLDRFASKMPRTCLRYAIEKLEEPSRQYYLNLK